MRLDMISRRRFLKSAGVAALAVAAAGVLAGCDGGDSSSKVPGTEVPDVPGTTSKSVKIIFADVDNGGAGVGNGGDDYEHPVLMLPSLTPRAFLRTSSRRAMSWPTLLRLRSLTMVTRFWLSLR